TKFSFIDLDELVESRAGMSVSEIFATEGEAAFRDMEMDALRHAAASGPAIIACGGGTPCAPGAMELMNSLGITVHLRTDMPRLVERLMEGRHKRPLIAAIDSEAEMLRFAQAKLDAREPYYSKAQTSFDSSRLETPEEISDSVNQFIAQYL
ncbi:MAG: shikimate kinase, partial [Muribaculaceae bacterium]|nr:shikimate kinase [Muribaculaceae bacterium]